MFGLPSDKRARAGPTPYLGRTTNGMIAAIARGNEFKSRTPHIGLSYFADTTCRGFVGVKFTATFQASPAG